MKGGLVAEVAGGRWGVGVMGGVVVLSGVAGRLRDERY